jgi:uncharacterized protein YfcZ (UPF0381/DUF406 family)
MCVFFHVVCVCFVEINLKQQLVDQLEKAQRSFYTMKAQYEDKMQLLQQQIKAIESERDRVLKDISKLILCVLRLHADNTCLCRRTTGSGEE